MLVLSLLGFYRRYHKGDRHAPICLQKQFLYHASINLKEFFLKGTGKEVFDASIE